MQSLRRMRRSPRKRSGKQRTVIGWSTYDNNDFLGVRHDDFTDEVWDAVKRDVEDHGYLFCGEDLQERSNCCPVLDDYRMARFSRRGFAALMADAHGETGDYDYARYMESFSIRESAKVYPDGEARPDPRVKTLPSGTRCHDLPLSKDLYELFLPLFTEEEDIAGETVVLNKTPVDKVYLLPVRQKADDPFFWARDAVQFFREGDDEPFPILLFIGRIFSFRSYAECKTFLTERKDFFDEELLYDDERIRKVASDGEFLLLWIR